MADHSAPPLDALLAGEPALAADPPHAATRDPSTDLLSGLSPDAPPEPPSADLGASMSERVARAGLAYKLLAVGSVFLLLALASIGLTLWVTWQMEGGAAAVNEAGRMRMRSYQLALTLQSAVGGAAARAQPVGQDVGRQIEQQLQAFDDSLALLRSGDPARPLTVPWDADTRARYQAIADHWAELRAQVRAIADGQASVSGLSANVDRFVDHIDTFVSAIETHLSGWTALLHTFQLAMMALAVLSAMALMYVGHVVVLDPVSRLQRGLQRIEQGDFAARVQVESHDELGLLADGFNSMAENLQALYGNLEAKVHEKTAVLETQQQRLSALYEVAAFVARADKLDELAQGFARQMRRIGHADAVAIRWSDEANERYVLLASDCLPHAMADEEQCISAGDCYCGAPVTIGRPTHLRIIPILDQSATPEHRAVRDHCLREGYATLVSVPVNLHQRVLGEVDLFYRGKPLLTDDERSLFEALASHLAGAMESLRAAALDRESAVAAERQLLAQELHDSIAQSLAFLKIQMQLLRDAMAKNDPQAVATSMDELDAGLRESYSDVRELLLHFRVRTCAEEIEPALRETLSKFEHQTQLPTHLAFDGQGLPLPPDVQIQVLHIVQEALSNVRKHARASAVWVTVQARPDWRVTVRDDGCGFEPQAHAGSDTHVGLRIMQERAQRIGALVEVRSDAGGTTVELRLPRTTPD